MTPVLFWGSLTVLTQTYLVFPATVLARGRWCPRPHQSAAITPTVTVVIAARDEESGIAEKLHSVLAGDYPADRLDVVVASDGSTDRTVDAATLDDERVRVLDLPRLGKAGTLNTAIAEATGSVIVFTDANSRFCPGTLTDLVRPFADPEVGGVAGDQRYEAGDDAVGERRYWDLDRALKLAESRSGNIIGATGALYAVRRELVEEVPTGVTDDFTTSTGVIASGRRLVFAPEAAVYEPVAASTGAEYRRKVRVMTRGLRAVQHRRALLDPKRHGFFSYQLANHKVLRRLMGLPLGTLLVASATGWRRGVLYRAALLGQVAVYVPAGVGLLWPHSRLGRSKPCQIAGYFCMVNAAGVVAAFNVLSGRQIDRWQPERSPGSGIAS